MVETEEFIEIIKSYALIWQINNKYHKDRFRIANAWSEISEKTQLPVEECKKKWKTLRDSFNREEAKHVGFEHEPYFARVWRYYNSMSFLQGNVRSKTRPSLEPPNQNMIECDESQSQNIEDSEFLEELEEPKPLKIAKLENQYVLDDCPIDTSSMRDISFLNSTNDMKTRRLSRKSNSDDDNEDKLFWASVAKKLSRFPLKEKNDTKVRLMQLVNEAEEKLFG